MTGDESSPAYKVEAATIREFLWLLEQREEGNAPSSRSHGATRRAIFVAQMLDQRGSGYGYPIVHRYVVAAFAYGRDAVSYRRTTSNAVELPEVAERIEERHQEAYEEIRTEIEHGLREVGLDLPVYEGFLPHAAENGRVRRDGSG